ncbi:MAG: DUF4411 family protein [Planctomycetes bacterium]|nr:DUF4411 family protein [Planctomycetota bacterium]
MRSRLSSKRKGFDMADLFPGYVIDTNALIDLWRRRYPRDVFPTLWQNLEALIRSGELVAPQEVLSAVT